MKQLTEVEFEKRRLAQELFDMVKVPEFKDKWGQKWMQRNAKFQRRFSDNQGHIQSSVWNAVELGKR